MPSCRGHLSVNHNLEKNKMGIDLRKKTVLFMIVQERKKMKILSALFVVVQSGVQIVNLLKIVILNLYRHYVYVKNVSN